MIELSVLTNELRDYIIEYYYLKIKDFDEDEVETENEEVIDDFDENEDEVELENVEIIDDYDEIDDNYEDSTEQFLEEESCEMFDALKEKIRNNSYNRIMYLILLQDAFEYIKTKEMKKLEVFSFEKEILNTIENSNLITLLNKINNDDLFFTDILVIFLEYYYEYNEEEKLKNRKLIEFSNEFETLKKFNVYLLDDIHYEYKKRRN